MAMTARCGMEFGETYSLLVNGNSLVLVLVIIASDDHPTNADASTTHDCSPFLPLKE